MDKEISQAVVSRLPRYFRYLGELKASGVERISSQELSDIMKVTASQIRQDFNNFGGFGQQGYGYNVEYLYDEISKILGIDKKHQLIIIGTGNLGTALAGYTNFSTRGFVFKGAFDCDPALQGKMIGDVEIRPIEEIEDLSRRTISISRFSQSPRSRQFQWPTDLLRQASRQYGTLLMWILMFRRMFRLRMFIFQTAL